MQRNKDYKTKEWRKIRAEVLKLDHYECQRCNQNMFDYKGPKKISRAVLVHHCLPLKDYPMYKYSIWVNGKRNLVSLCFDCHEVIEGRHKDRSEQFTTEERFD